MILKYDEYEQLNEEAISDFYDLAGDITWLKNNVATPIKKFTSNILTKPLQIYLNRKIKNMGDEEKLMFIAKITRLITKFKKNKAVDWGLYGGLITSMSVSYLTTSNINYVAIYMSIYIFWLIKNTLSGIYKEKADEYYDQIRGDYIDYNFEDEEIDDEWEDVDDFDDDFLNKADSIKRGDFHGNVKIYYTDDGELKQYKFAGGTYYIKDVIERRLDDLNPLFSKKNKHIKIGNWEIIENGENKWILKIDNIRMDKSKYPSLLRNNKGIKNYLKNIFIDREFVDKVEIEKINESIIIKFENYGI